MSELFACEGFVRVPCADYGQLDKAAVAEARSAARIPAEAKLIEVQWKSGGKVARVSFGWGGVEPD